MAIIRQKKRNLILAMLLGIVITAVPMGVYSGTVTYKKLMTDKEIKNLMEEINSEKVYTAYCLTRSMSKGELIRAEDLEEISVKTKSSFKVLDRSDLEGRYLSVGMEAGIIITNSVIYQDCGLEDNVRTYLYDYIVLPEGISSDDIFDIRIRFPNGEDYVIAVGKKVESMVESVSFINASEEENLLLSSAYVDTTVYEGAKIYASLYVADYQEASCVNYPFNLYTTELAAWDPNLVEQMETETNRLNRQILEKNLFDFMGVVMGGETLTDIY